MSVQLNPFRPVPNVVDKVRVRGPLKGNITFGNTNPTDRDSVELDQDTAKKIEAERKRLEGEIPPASYADKQIPKVMKLRADLMDSLPVRANFNVTGNPEVLSQYLPYREKLKKENPKKLDAYDALVNKLLKQADFYEADNGKDFYKKLDAFHAREGKPESFLPIRWVKNFFQGIKNLFVHLRASFDPDFRRSYIMKQAKKLQAKGHAVDEWKLKGFLEENTHKTLDPSSDPSSRYLFAAEVAELFHQKGHYVDNVLSAKTGNQVRPLKVIITKNRPFVAGGQYRVGLNTIWLNQNELWAQAKTDNHLGHHEFVHALSENGDLTMLPESVMNPGQKERFLKARSSLLEQYHTKDKSWLDLGHIIQKDLTSTGLPFYAFKDDLEFLTKSLDTFKNEPENLRKSEAGQDLYDLYKEIFDIDPLNDLKRAEPAESKPQLSQTA